MNMFLSLHQNIKIRMLTSFLTRTVSSMLFPFMAIYFAERINATASGLIMLVNVGCTILVSLYGGVICDQIGRKRVMVIGQVFQLMSIIVLTIANSPWLDSVTLTFFMLLVNSMSSGLVSPAAEAMLIDVSTPENRTFMYSFNYWIVNLSIMIGSVFGGLFYREYRFELYIALTIITVFTTYLLVAKMVETTKPAPKGKPTSIFKQIATSYKEVAENKTFLLFCLATLLILSLEFQMYNYVSVRLVNDFPGEVVNLFGTYSFNVDGLRIKSGLTIINTVIVVLFTLKMAAIIRNYEQKKVLYIGLIIHVLGFLFVSSSTLYTLLFIGILLQTIGEITYVPARQTLMIDLIDENKRGAYMAVHGLVFQGAKLMGALGLIVGAYASTQMMLILFALMGITSTILFATIFEKKAAAVSLSKKSG